MSEGNSSSSQDGRHAAKGSSSSGTSSTTVTTNTVISVSWKLVKFASKKRQKEILYLSRFDEEKPLKGECESCDRNVRHKPSRNDHDLIVKVIVLNDERYVSIMVAPYVGDVIQDLTVSDINTLPIFKCRYPPRTRQLVESLCVEPYLGNSSTLYVSRSLHNMDDFNRLSRKFLNCSSGIGGEYIMFADDRSSEPISSQDTSSHSHDKCGELPTAVFPVIFKFSESNGQQIECCKAMLALRSPVFAQMFEPNLAVQQTADVLISDCNYQTFKRFLQFVLLGEEVYLRSEGETLKQCAAQMLPVASRYGISDLCEMCAVVLVDNLAVESALNTIELLQKHYTGRRKHLLMAKTMNFIKVHPAVMNDTTKWDDLAVTYPELLRQVIITCL